MSNIEPQETGEFRDPFGAEFPNAESGLMLNPARQDEESDDIFKAFSRFVQVHVAQGDATDDTIRAYYREVGFWVEWCGHHNVEVASARRIHLEMYRQEMKQQGLRINTRSHKLSIIRRFYDSAVQSGLRDDNPVAGVRGGKDQTPGEEKIKSLTSAALARLMSVINTDNLVGKRDRAIIALMAIHGLRRIEVERMDESSLLVQDELVSVEVQGKGNRMRQVYLRPDTYRVMADYLVNKHKEGFVPEGPCFISLSNRSKGQRISRRSLNEIVDHYLNEASLKRVGVSCHSLRHTFGTLSIAGGARVEDLKEAMGHVELESTELYVKAVARVEHNPANFIDIEV